MKKRFSFKRGNVYLIKFPPPDKPKSYINKFAVNLQEGKIIHNCPTFVCVLIHTFKNDITPILYIDNVFLTAEESHTKFGAKIICNQIHTIPKSDIIALKYKLTEETMKKVNEALLLGIGIVKIEDLEEFDEEQLQYFQ